MKKVDPTRRPAAPHKIQCLPDLFSSRARSCPCIQITLYVAAADPLLACTIFLASLATFFGYPLVFTRVHDSLESDPAHEFGRTDPLSGPEWIQPFYGMTTRQVRGTRRRVESMHDVYLDHSCLPMS